MGVKLKDIVEKKSIDADALAGKTLAVDALNTLYQFLSIIRQYDGTPLKDENGNVTSHLSGIFYRSINLMQKGIKLVYVFDGKPPEFKLGTNHERRKMREEAKRKWDEALERGEVHEAKKYAQASVEITSEMLSEAKELLLAIGIPIVEAPSEGEAQASYMNRKGDVYAVASSDYDSILFGAPRLVRNLNISGKRKLAGTNIYRDIEPEIIELDPALALLGISREKLVWLGILVGTDYNPGGIKGLGPKKALKVVMEHETLESLEAAIEWPYPIPMKDIFDFFMKPPVTDDYKLDFGEPDRAKIREIMCDRHGFSDERVASMFKKLDELKEKKKQTSLFSWGK